MFNLAVITVDNGVIAGVIVGSLLDGSQAERVVVSESPAADANGQRAITKFVAS